VRQFGISGLQPIPFGTHVFARSCIQRKRYQPGEHSQSLAHLPTAGPLEPEVPLWFGSTPGDINHTTLLAMAFNSSPPSTLTVQFALAAWSGFYAFNPDGSVKWSYVPPVPGANVGQLLANPGFQLRILSNLSRNWA